MNTETLKVLVVTDVSSEATRILRLLEGQFSHVEASTVEGQFAADFDRVRPDVLVLAFNSLEHAERCALGLYRRSESAHTQPYRSIVLCNKDNVHRAYELCRQEYFDDYVMYWPLVYDTYRLAMSILIAGRALKAQQATPSAQEMAAHARSVSQLEAVLDDGIAIGRLRADAVSEALRDAEAEAARAAAAHAATPASPLPSPALAPGEGGAGSFELDLDGVPSGLDAQRPAAAPRQQEALQQVRVRIEEAKQRAVPLTEWIGGLKNEVKPQLEAVRQLGELAGRTQRLVLVVDDDQFQCKLLERLLQTAGYRTIFAHSGVEALAVLRRQLPQLILMDVELPDLSGVEITRNLKSSTRTAAIPIVMISGHSELQVLQASLKAGAVDFLVKPFDREVLLTKLSRHIAK